MIINTTLKILKKKDYQRLFQSALYKLVACRYLYFDVQRAVELLGGEALSQAQAAAGNVTFVDHSSDADKIPFCLGNPPLTTATTTPSTQAVSNSSNDNQTQSVVTTTNSLVVSSASDEVTKELLKADPVSNLLTGGGTCR